MAQKLEISHFLLKIAKFSYFEALVHASENFLRLNSDWDLFRISRATKYSLTKKIVGSTQAGIKKLHISSMNPLDPLSMKI